MSQGINIGGKSIVWTFAIPSAPHHFPLSKIVSGADGITVYVTENPSYQGG
ncbi:MAG: CzcE family metal-binding protein [Betaproteobacteria bacterium]|nr:CzcE family metal-binding protein [Betaproteobacteria bacterium]